MADYGAFIDVNGNPFITPLSTPFALYSKGTIASGNVNNTQYADRYVDIPLNVPVIAFCKTTNTNNGTALSAFTFRSGANVGKIYFQGVNPANQAFVMTYYIFAIFPQTLPSWGMAVWDAQGKLILTNETKVLSDLTTVGTPGYQSGGLNIDVTLQGSWAVVPTTLGNSQIQIGTLPTGQPVISNAAAGTSCRYNGVQTRINAQSTLGSGNVLSTTNNGNVITAINTAAYD